MSGPSNNTGISFLPNEAFHPTRVFEQQIKEAYEWAARVKRKAEEKRKYQDEKVA